MACRAGHLKAAVIPSSLIFHCLVVGRVIGLVSLIHSLCVCVCVCLIVYTRPSSRLCRFYFSFPSYSDGSNKIISSIT